MVRRSWSGLFRGLCAFAAVAAIVADGPVARAQRGDSGSIFGYVFDQTGAPLSGVKVTIASDTQIGGRKTAYTNAEGAFRFPALAPGTFQVKVEAPKLQTVVQENVKVGINAPIELNLVMEIASTQVEEVKVVEKAPLVSTSTANVKEVFDVDFVDSMPHDNRDVIFRQITDYAAGAIRGGRMRGGAATQTILTMDGFNMLRQYPTVKASAAYEIQSAAYGAENAAAPGGVVNLVTRSGSNKFEFELNATADHQSLEFGRDGTDPVNSGFFYILNPTVSGPIIKDKLWYSANVEFLTRNQGRETDAAGVLPDPLPDLRYWHKGTVKLTWQMTARNKLQSVTNFDEFWQKNRQGLGYAKEAQGRHRSRNYFMGLIWESILTDNLVFRSQAGYIHNQRHTFPELCVTDPDHCDFVPQTAQIFPARLRSGNFETHELLGTFSLQFANRLEWFASHKVLGDHHIQLKDHYIRQSDDSRRSVPGDTIEEFNGTTPDALTTYYSNDPRLEPARYGYFITTWGSSRNVLSLSDSWRPTRYLTLTPGLAFTSASANNSAGDQILAANALSPSLAVAWDATHDGRTVLRGSFNQYVDVDVSTISSHTLGTQVNQRCRWNDATAAYDRECTFSGGRSGATFGLPCGPTGVDESGNRCNQELGLPRTWEYTAGVEREVTPGLALALDGIYRKFNNQYERLETNRVWNQSGSGLDRTGGYRNGRAQTVSDLETPDGAERTYRGVTAAVTRREGRLKLRGSYTWSTLEGTVLEGNDNFYGDIGPRDPFLYGPLGDDHRHEIKANLSYRFAPWLSATMRYSYYSGTPYNRRFRNDVTGRFENQRARVGTNPGTNINDPTDDRELRLPDFQSLNAQVALNFLPLIGQNLETFVDVLNVLGLRTTTSVEEDDGPLWGIQRGRMAPLRIRFGLRYRY
jgi:hypothetical protein